MRDYLVFLVLAPLVPYTLVMPHVGVLLWCWVAFMSPHRLIYGFLSGANLNMVIASTTIVGWIISKEKKIIPSSATAILIYMFMFWITLTSFFNIGNEFRNWNYWDRSFKSMVLVIFVMALMRSKVRIQAVIWIIVLGIGYYDVKVGIFVIQTGGN